MKVHRSVFFVLEFGWVAQNEVNDDFLSGCVFDNTFRVPTDDVIDQWRVSAGLIDADADNSLIAELDTYLTGDVNFGNDEEAER